MKILVTNIGGWKLFATTYRAYDLTIATGNDVTFLIMRDVGGVARYFKLLWNVPVIGGPIGDLLISISQLRKMRGYRLIHAFKPLLLNLSSFIASSLEGVPLILDIDDWEELFTGKISGIVQSLMSSHATALTTPNFSLYKHFKERGSRAYYIPNGVNTRVFNPNAEPIILSHEGVRSSIVMHSGAISVKNDVDLLLTSFHIVKQELPDTSLFFVGDYISSNDREFVQKLAKRLGISFYVTGWLDRKVIPNCLASATVCVSTLRNKPIHQTRDPIKIAEYMAMGKPIVATKVGEVARKLQGCALITEDSPDEVAEATLRLLKDGKLAKRLGERARKRAAKYYDWKVLGKKLNEVYREVAFD